MDRLQTRSSGILLHITSLPNQFGIGDLGPGAYRFADFLAGAGQHIWQVLPLVPTGYGNSPYSSPSTFAHNPLLISPQLLEKEGLLHKSDLAASPDFPDARIDIHQVGPFKFKLLTKAFEQFEQGHTDLNPADFDTFCEKHHSWLDDYTLFISLKQAFEEKPWTAWDDPLRSRRSDALKQARKTFAREIRMRKFWQYLFARQWTDLQTYCHERSIHFFGDLPIYVAHDSADVWAHPDLFYLDESGRSTVVAGVPPDYFSETGQRWGNPIYRWDVMKANDYSWWTQRFAATLELVDIVRLDHFRGFEAYWEIPASEPTAIDGRWVDGPGTDLFESVEQQLGRLPVVAENLGLITPEVTELMNKLSFPGMAVLQFGFLDAPDSDYLPHNYTRRLVAYTGTHDNDTTMGWWTKTARSHNDEDKRLTSKYVKKYLDLENKARHNIHWAFIRAVMGSSANTAVFPLQDILGLGSEARMNTPGLENGNWTWRFSADQLTGAVEERLRTLTEIYGRTKQRAESKGHRA